MNTLYAIITFIVGLAIGSFLNVVILRVNDLKSLWTTRSHCPDCKQSLKWNDLIPFFSFVLLRGRCRYCGKPISWQYPAVELGTALLYLILFLTFGLSLAMVFYIVIFSLLAVVFVHDIKTQETPEIIVWITLILSVLGGWYFGNFSLQSFLLGGLVGSGLLAILVVISHEKWMGAGDIKIGLILGLLVGYPQAVLGMFGSFLLGAIAGLIYMKMAGKTLKDSLPFAPSLILAALLTLVFGRWILSWYLGYFSY